MPPRTSRGPPPHLRGYEVMDPPKKRAKVAVAPAGKRLPRLFGGEDCVQYLTKRLQSGEIKETDPPQAVFQKHGALFHYTQGTFRNKLIEAKRAFLAGGGIVTGSEPCAVAMYEQHGELEQSKDCGIVVLFS